MRPPVEVGDAVEVEIEDLGTSGDGVGRYRDYVIFVEGAVPGDRVSVNLTSVGSSFGRARVAAFEEYSRLRTEPRCALYGTCGGCQLQHISHVAEARFKRSWVEAALRRIAQGDDARVESILTPGEVYGYRHRTRFATKVDARGALTPCFHRRDGDGLVAVSRCEVQTETGNRLLGVLGEVFSQPGSARGPAWEGISIGVAEDESLLLFGTGTGSWDAGGHIAGALMEQVPNLAGVVRQVVLPEGARRGPSGVLSLPLAGRDHLEFRDGDLRLRASAGVFSQINPRAASTVYDRAVQLADVGPKDTVLELFSGIGLLTLRLAQGGAFVIGVELDGTAVADARNNAAMNGFDSVVHVNADAAEGLRETLSAGTRPDVVVVDPPRCGCSRDLLDLVASSGARRLVYISCHYGTWARDLRYLERFDWEPKRVTPVDMFPQTNSVELVSLVEPGGV